MNLEFMHFQRAGSQIVPSTPSKANDAHVPAAPTPAVEATSTASFLNHAAHRWPVRSGGRRLQAACGSNTYEALLTGAVSAEDEEQLQLDVERSAVDGLEELYVSPLVDDASMRDALGRLLRAWCCRHPAGYCQGMNFVAAVLLVVMHHRDATETVSGGSEPQSAAEQRNVRAEEDAFWTFCAMMELLLPADFFSAPHMPGLQTDARVLVQLFVLTRRPGGELATLAGSGVGGAGDEDIGDGEGGELDCESGDGDEGGNSRRTSATEPSIDEWRDILRLVAYKWFLPCYVNCLPLPTLLHYWDRLLLRAPSEGTPVGLSSAHLALALALLHQTADGACTAMRAARPGEGMGLGFNHILAGALSDTDGAHLVSSALSRFDLSPRQLRYLRARLSANSVPRGGSRLTSDGSLRRDRSHVAAGEPRLSGLQEAALCLMAPARRFDSRVLRALKWALLLEDPRPMPRLPVLPPVRFTPYYPQLVRVCALTFAAFVVHMGRRTLGSRVPSACSASF